VNDIGKIQRKTTAVGRLKYSRVDLHVGFRVETNLFAR